MKVCILALVHNLWAVLLRGWQPWARTCAQRQKLLFLRWQRPAAIQKAPSAAQYLETIGQEHEFTVRNTLFDLGLDSLPLSVLLPGLGLGLASWLAVGPGITLATYGVCSSPTEEQ